MWSQQSSILRRVDLSYRTRPHGAFDSFGEFHMTNNQHALPGSCIFRILLLLVAAVVLSPSQQVLADQASDDFNLAVGLYRKQRWDLAADSFRQFLDTYPEHERTNLSRLYLGLSLHSLKQYDEARQLFVDYSNEEPEGRNIADARYRIAECSYHLNEFKASIEQFDLYLKNHSGHELNSWALLFSGDAHVNLQQWSEAQTKLRQLLGSSPPAQLVTDAKFSLAGALEGAGNITDAIVIYRELADATSASIASRSSLRIGAILFRQRKYREAAETYDQIIDKTQDNTLKASASLNAGLAWYRSGEFEKAVQRLEAIPDGSRLQPRSLMLTGLSFRELKQWEQAREALDKSLVLSANTSLEPEIVFERAQLERLAGDQATSAQMFEDFADRWSEDSRVADSLFNAAELRLELSENDKARALFDRLKASGDAGESPSRKVLEARILLKEQQAEQAVSILKSVVSDSESSDATDRTAVIGRYYLVRTYHQTGQHQEAVTTLQPLLQILDDEPFADLRGILAAGAISSLQLKNYAVTRQYADKYMDAQPEGKQTADVLAARCVASAHLNEFDQSVKDGQTLVSDFADKPQAWNAILQAAEAAWQKDQFVHSEALFALAAGQQSNVAVRAAGLSGQAWSLYRRKQLDESRQLFSTLVDELPDADSAPESQYMVAMTLMDSGKDDEALVEFQKCFEAGKAELATDSEFSKARRKYAFEAGQMVARLLGDADKIDQADQQWDELVKSFPNASGLDQILDEWAYLNLVNKRYDRSDKIYRRLLEQFGESQYAGQARLSLAESDMQADRTEQAIAEFQAIVDEPKYGAQEKEKALYQLIDVFASRRNWIKVRELAGLFAKHHSTSDRAPRIQLLYAESLLDLQELALAVEQLELLRTAVKDGLLAPDEWTERIWVVLAETALASGDYEQIDGFVDELSDRVPGSRYTFQMFDIQGRRWKSQAEPDFDKAIEYFRKVTQDEHGRGTATAARCQFMIAETYLLQKDYSNARKEFYRVYLTYEYDEWQARALFQAAGCELALDRKSEAARNYKDLIKEFPESELVSRAEEQLKALPVSE